MTATPTPVPAPTALTATPPTRRKDPSDHRILALHDTLTDSGDMFGLQLSARPRCHFIPQFAVRLFSDDPSAPACSDDGPAQDPEEPREGGGLTYGSERWRSHGE